MKEKVKCVISQTPDWVVGSFYPVVGDDNGLHVRNDNGYTVVCCSFAPWPPSKIGPSTHIPWEYVDDDEPRLAFEG